MKKCARRILVPVLVLPGLLLSIMIVGQILLSEEFCTSILRRVVPEYVDGNVKIGKVSVSLFKRFPAISADIDSLILTYPADRFDESQKSWQGERLVFAGTSASPDGADTLVAFRHLSAAINVIPLLAGKINVKYVKLFKPRVFLHFYNDGRSNLDALKIALHNSTPEDSSAVVLPPITIRKLMLDERAAVCYTSQKDSLAAMLLLKDFFFDGHFSLDDINESSFDSRLDSLLVVGSLGRDTLLFDLDHFNAAVGPSIADLSADAKLYAATKAFGRIKIPAHLKGRADYDIASVDGPYNISLTDFKFDVASVGTVFNTDIRVSDSIGINGSVAIDTCHISDVLDEYLINYIPVLNALGTDAVLSAKVDASGYFNSSTGVYPVINLDLTLPEFSVFDRNNRSNSILRAKTFASVEDLFGKDPSFKVDALIHTDLNNADELIGKQLGIDMAGLLNASAKGEMNLSELTSLDFKKGKIDASVAISDLKARSSDDTLNLYVHNFDAKAGMKQSPGSKRSSVVCEAALDSVFLKYADAALIAGKDIRAKAFASSTPVRVSDTLKYYPFFIKADIESVRMYGTDSLEIGLKNSTNRLSIHPPFEKDANGKAIRSVGKDPVINILSHNAMIFTKMGANRVFMRQLVFDGRSCAHKKDTNPVDSQRRPSGSRSGTRPDWMSEEDFRKSDISFDFGQAFRNFFEKYDVQGSLSLDRGGIATPYFPAKTRIRGMRGEFNNNTLMLDSLTVVSGSSHFRAEGKIENLRGAIIRKRPVRLNLNLRTDSLNVNELYALYARGQANRSKDMSSLSTADFDKVEQLIEEHSADTALRHDALVVMPANIIAEVGLKGSGVKYSTMSISELSAKLRLQKRCLLFEDFNARTNMGSIHADAFYSTKTKKDICAGFDLDLKEISANQMIQLVPSVDSLFPLLKSFSGKIDCSMAATSSLDTCMNFIPSSMDGVVRIQGTDLKFVDNPDFKKIAKKLLFKKPDNAVVDSMMVEGILKKGTLEVFPFFLKMDRWQLAFAGIQNLDKSFNYHMSLIESPLLIRLGINVSGEDFDNFKIKIGKARFRNRNSIPVFTKQIDSTRVNLLESIHNILQVGAEKAIREFLNSEKVDSVRRSLNYDRSAALDNLETTEIPEALSKVNDQ